MINRKGQFKCITAISIVVLLLVVSCKKENEAVDFHFDYFPIEQNKFVTYAVHEVIVDSAVNQYDTLDYFLKAVIGDTIIDNQGRVARRYERFTSDNVSGPWILKDIWTTILVDNRLELIEENNRTIKLVFSPTKFKEWNANAYNTLPALDCYYTDIHLPLSINGLSFDSTVTIEQEDVLNFIQYKRKFEKYAKNVGMVYKHYKDFEIKFFDSTNVVKGRELIMSAVDYGKQ